MTTFKEIRGTTIEVVSSDPSNPEIGQIWYNSSSGTLKGYVYATVNAWSAGGNLNNGRTLSGGAGTQTAALVAAGGVGASPYNSNAAESYNGTSWSNLTPVNTARRGGVIIGGTNTASLVVGGYDTAYVGTTESWNGSSWTTVNPMSQGRASIGRIGIQTAALAIGGYYSPPPTGWYPIVESYNGSTWTSVASLNTTRSNAGGAGLQTAGLAFGGDKPVSTAGNETESWNGSAWTNVNSLNTARTTMGSAGTQTAALCFGPTATELWNGISWTTSPTGGMGSPRNSMGSTGSQTLALGMGGDSGPQTQTEEWTGAAFQTKTITVS